MLPLCTSKCYRNVAFKPHRHAISTNPRLGARRSIVAFAKNRMRIYELDIHAAIDITVEQEHEKVNDYIDDYLNPDATPEQQQTAVWLLIKALSMHLVKKEMVMYPAIRVHLGDSIADKGLVLHKKLKQALLEFDSTPADSPGFRSKFEAFAKELKTQFDQEAKSILPALRRLPDVDLKQLEQMGIDFAWAEYAAPSRPHLDLPQRPPFDEDMFKRVKAEDIKRDLERYNVLQY